MAETIKEEGIVLNVRQAPVDAAKMLEIYSPSRGRFFAMIRGVEKPKAKLAAAASPFCFGEFLLAEKAGRYTVIDCAVHDTFFSLAYNLDSYVLSSAMLEITSKLSVEGEGSIELFMLLVNSLKGVAYDRAEPTVALIKFIIETLNISGFGFELSRCGECGKDVSVEKHVSLVYDGSGVLCAACERKRGSINLSGAEWNLLKLIHETEIAGLSEINAPERETLDELLRLSVRQFYYRTGEKITSLSKYL